MRFLIDNNLSPVVVSLLTEAGHDAVHVRDRSLQGAVLESAQTNLDTIAADLECGAVVVLTDQSIRIRRLPLLP